MKCYREGGCGPYEMLPCGECPASKPEYLKRYGDAKPEPKEKTCKNCGQPPIKEWCEGWPDEVCEHWTPMKPKTNRDLLRSKSDAELAEWLAEVLSHCSNNICDENCPMYECCNNQESDNIEDWLRQEKKQYEFDF